MLPCQIFSIDPDNDNDEIEDFTGRDFWDLIEDAERLFRKCGVNIASYEELYSACVTSTGKVVGATVAGNAGYLDEDGELDPRPTIRFSTVVDEQLRRKGVARGLVQDIVDAYPEDEFVLEAWVINPHMVSLLTEFGFETMGREWSLDSPMMTRQNPDEEMRKLERKWRRSSDIPAFIAWIRQMLRTDPENPQLDPFRCDGCSEVVLSDTVVDLKTCSECNLRHCSTCEKTFLVQFYTCASCSNTVCDGMHSAQILLSGTFYGWMHEGPDDIGPETTPWPACSRCGIRVCNTCQQSLDPDPMIGRCRVCNQMVCTKFISVNHEACSHAYHDQHDPTTYGGDHPYFICKTHDF